MALPLEGRLAITELIALHGHLADEGELDRLAVVFTPDIEYDLTDFGQPTLTGLPQLVDAALTLGARNSRTARSGHDQRAWASERTARAGR